jgi:hypothetical protein
MPRLPDIRSPRLRLGTPRGNARPVRHVGLGAESGLGNDDVVGEEAEALTTRDGEPILTRDGAPILARRPLP